MPLDIEILKTGFEEAIKEAQAKGNVDDSWRTFVDAFATAIDKFVRSGEVETTGTAQAQTGKIT